MRVRGLFALIPESEMAQENCRQNGRETLIEQGLDKKNPALVRPGADFCPAMQASTRSLEILKII